MILVKLKTIIVIIKNSETQYVLWFWVKFAAIIEIGKKEKRKFCGTLMFEISDIVTLLKKIKRRIIYDDFNRLGLIIVSLNVCEITQPEKRNIIKNEIFK